jgi:hypothetical protein
MMNKKGLSVKTLQLVLVVTGLCVVVASVLVLASDRVGNLLLAAISWWKNKPPSPAWPAKLHLLAADILVDGILLAALGWLVPPRWKSILSLAQKERFVLFGATLILVVLWVPVVLSAHSVTIGGIRYWWLGDDAMISMRYAHNLSSGHGLVWNPGERVEGYTNFLWTLYMAVVHLFPISLATTSLVISLTNIALALATVPVIVRLVRVMGGRTLAATASLACYTLNTSIMYWTTSGYETTLLSFLFLLTTYRVLRESQLDQPKLTTYLLIGIMALVRSDAIVLSGLLVLLSFLLTRNKKRVLLFSALSLLLPAAHELFRLYYYGDVLPNTAYLKTSNWDGRYITGLRYTVIFAARYALFVVFAVAGSLRSFDWSQRSLGLVLLTYAAYVTFVGGDAFSDFRFFVPVLPLLMALAFVGIQGLVVQQSRQLAFVALCLVTMPLFVLYYPSTLMPNQDEVGNLKIGLVLKENTPVASKVADTWAGSVLYFSERYGIDLLGKSDRHIAHLPTIPNANWVGHNKFDYDYSIGVLRPDCIVIPFRLPLREDEMRRVAVGDVAFQGQLYFNDLFHEHFLPHPVPVDTWRTIFVSDWSPLMQGINEWKDVEIQR